MMNSKAADNPDAENADAHLQPRGPEELPADVAPRAHVHAPGDEGNDHQGNELAGSHGFTEDRLRRTEYR